MAKDDESVVTYVVVVHGMGEQRKNEAVTAVINRFAEARRDASENDRRDVLTLGAVSQQTGTSMDPAALGKDEQHWMAFEGIPRIDPGSPNNLGPFMGQATSARENLRFVDMCWSDVLRAAYMEVGQPVDVWARSLLGRLLRKHEGAKENSHAQVPFWIRRTLYLLADGLLLTRKAMRFRFKEMEDLVFTKYLGDVQVYGEYDRCRGRAVRRFHDMMKRIEDKHQNDKTRPEYVVIAHSLGTVMSFDALMYARAKSNVRSGDVPCWQFPGYLDSDSEREVPSTDWIGRVKSFVTLGSPIDKYLLIWWMNYRYLCTDKHLKETHGKGGRRIRHFNYCDELDPVGHHLEVASETAAYRAVFENCEDIVFNRYGVPGLAHNEYWADEALWRWIIARSVDNNLTCENPPKWFQKNKYRQLLRWLYFWVPVTVVGVGYATLTLALQSSSWRTAVLAAASFAVVLYLGRRLIDLAVWWRQVQRREGEAARERQSKVAAENCETKKERKNAARGFQRAAAVWPFVMAMFGAAGVWLIASGFWKTNEGNWIHMLEGSDRGVLVAFTVFAVFLLIAHARLPKAYRTTASGERRSGAEWVAGLFGAMSITLGVVAGFTYPEPVLKHTSDFVRDFVWNVTFLSVLATVVWAYRWRRFQVVRKTVNHERGNVRWSEYAQRTR
ncbi:MAG: hypothetical protein OXC69_10765 [Candidatus Tectomicrobia bacterium]|nr:hypothetical protein [Candidatus Tectomicrobia bacterium]